jgi:hypothetical protein
MRTFFKLGLLITLIGFALISCSNNENQASEVKLIPVKNGKDYEYIDRSGKIVINPQFSDATVFRGGLALVKSSGDDQKWGYISESGTFAIPAVYQDATFFSEGLAWVVSENAPPMAINTKGEVKITLKDAEYVNIFQEGLGAYSVIDSSGDRKWGFIDLGGNFKISPQFFGADYFSEGKCAVQNNKSKWGYIDKDGKIVINYQFDRAGKFINGKAVVYAGNKAGLIDKNGKYLINPQYSEMINDFSSYLIGLNGKYGWCDKDGKMLINPQFTAAYPFLGNKLTAVKIGNEYGYIDNKGKIVINPQFDVASPFNGSISMVENNDMVGFIDNSGRYVVNPQFNGISSDYWNYLFNDFVNHGTVKTDYFNIDAIINSINMDSPEGQTVNEPIFNILNKWKKDSGDFNQGFTQFNIYSNRKINNEVSLDFYVYANPFSDITDGWYTKKVFNPEAKVFGFTYSINISIRNLEKIDNVIEALEKSLKGYHLEQTANGTVYRNDKQSIQISQAEKGSSSLMVEIVANSYLDSLNNKQVNDQNL